MDHGRLVSPSALSLLFPYFFSSTLKIYTIILWVFNYEIGTCLKDNGADLPNSEVAGGFWAAPGAFYSILQCAPFSKSAKSPSLVGVTAFPFPIPLRYIFCSFSLSLTSPMAQCLRPRDCCPPPRHKQATGQPQRKLLSVLTSLPVSLVSRGTGTA